MREIGCDGVVSASSSRRRRRRLQRKQETGRTNTMCRAVKTPELFFFFSQKLTNERVWKNRQGEKSDKRGHEVVHSGWSGITQVLGRPEKKNGGSDTQKKKKRLHKRTKKQKRSRVA